MKFLLDNNLSIHLALALKALCAPHGVHVIHLRERFAPDTLDHDWIAELGQEGDWSIITQDRLTENVLEKEALRQSGMTALILAKGWVHLQEWDKAWRLVRWWPRIMDQAGMIAGGAIFAVPTNFSGKGKFQQITM